MAAIITDDFRRNQAELLVNDIKASLDSAYDNSTPTSTMQDQHRTNSVYAIGLGKTDKWPNDINANGEDNLDFIIRPPSGTQQEDEDVINNLFTLKEVQKTAVQQLIPKNVWTSGRKYKVYDATDNDCYYVTGDVYPSYVTHSEQIYLCVSNTALSNPGSNPGGVSTAPTHTGQTVAGTTDGYVWAHIQALPTDLQLKKFITPQFVPVLELDPVLAAHATIITNSTTNQGGLLSHIGVIDGGTGYTSSTTVTVTAVLDDGTEQDLAAYQFIPIISGTGVIERIEIQAATAEDEDTGNSTYWSGTRLTGLKSATVKIVDSGSTRQASAFALVSPTRGWAADAVGTLPTWFVAIVAEFAGTEGGDAQTLKFRQVSLVKNFVRNDDDDTPISYDALKFINCGSAPTVTNLVPGDILVQAGSNAKFYFDYADGSHLYYHQNSNGEVNFIDPIQGDNQITVHTAATVPTGTPVVTSSIEGVYDGEFPHRDSDNNEFNGEVLFLENRVPFTRAATQTEEVKLIVQL